MPEVAENYFDLSKCTPLSNIQFIALWTAQNVIYSFLPPPFFSALCFISNRSSILTSALQCPQGGRIFHLTVFFWFYFVIAEHLDVFSNIKVPHSMNTWTDNTQSVADLKINFIFLSWKKTFLFFWSIKHQVYFFWRKLQTVVSLIFTR